MKYDIAGTVCSLSSFFNAAFYPYNDETNEDEHDDNGWCDDNPNPP